MACVNSVGSTVPGLSQKTFNSINKRAHFASQDLTKESQGLKGP